MLSAIIPHAGRTDRQRAVARAAHQAAVQVFGANGYRHGFSRLGTFLLFNLLDAVIELGNRIKRAAAELFRLLILFKRAGIVATFARDVAKRCDGRTILIISRGLYSPEIIGRLIEMAEHHV